jgi:hypothetical protein
MRTMHSSIVRMTFGLSSYRVLLRLRRVVGAHEMTEGFVPICGPIKIKGLQLVAKSVN